MIEREKERERERGHDSQSFAQFTSNWGDRVHR